MYKIFGMIFYLSLYVMRWLGAVGVLGLIAYPFGLYRRWIWVWIVLLALGFFGAAMLEKIKKEAEVVRQHQNPYR
jgi:hypothetical protein